MSGSSMPDFEPLGNLNRLLHEPARLMLAAILYSIEQADFLFLLRETGLTKGNLSAHLSKLEQAGYVQIDKTYRGKIPQTLVRLSPAGQAAFEMYRRELKRVVESLPEAWANE